MLFVYLYGYVTTPSEFQVTLCVYTLYMSMCVYALHVSICCIHHT
jgi:hypothetical protein